MQTQELYVKWNKSLHLRRLRALQAVGDGFLTPRTEPAVARLSDSSGSEYRTPPSPLPTVRQVLAQAETRARVLPGSSALLTQLQQRAPQV